MIPSFTALECMALIAWRQADLNLTLYPPVSGKSWTVSASGNVMIDWDSDENMFQVRRRVALIRKGALARQETGSPSFRCKCKKSRNYCKCISCYNVPGANPHDAESNGSDSEESTTDELQDEVNTIIRVYRL